MAKSLPDSRTRRIRIGSLLIPLSHAAGISVVSLLGLRFLTDSLAISAAGTGLIFAAVKIYDGLLDPAVGARSNRTRSRCGRRLPFLFAGQLAMALAALCSVFAASPAWAGKLRILPAEEVWPDGVPPPGDWPGIAVQPVTESLTADGEMVINVTVPTYQAYLPARGKANGAAVIVAPGGGFRHLSIRKDGAQVAEWLAARGIAAFVLKYRLIQTLPGEDSEAMRVRLNRDFPNERRGEPASADGIQALRLIRSRAARYGIDPRRIGVVGFSAGGHVAGMMALSANLAERPNFAGLIYGMPFFTPPPSLPPANLPFPPGTPSEPWLQPEPTPAPGALPRLFMVLAQDDVIAGSGFRQFYDALFASGYRPELHLYTKGGHGFGMKPQGTSSDRWIDQFHTWIVAEGLTRR